MTISFRNEAKKQEAIAKAGKKGVSRVVQEHFDRLPLPKELAEKPDGD